MSQSSPLLILCGLYCVPMLLVLMLGVFIGRYRPRLRSPIQINGEPDKLIRAGTPEAKAAVRRIIQQQKDNAGYGG